MLKTKKTFHHAAVGDLSQMKISKISKRHRHSSNSEDYPSTLLTMVGRHRGVLETQHRSCPALRFTMS